MAQGLDPKQLRKKIDFKVVDLALNQAAKPWKPIFRSLGTICGFVSETV